MVVYQSSELGKVKHGREGRCIVDLPDRRGYEKQYRPVVLAELKLRLSLALHHVSVP